MMFRKKARKKTDLFRERIRQAVDAEEQQASERKRSQELAEQQRRLNEQKRNKIRVELALERARRMGCGVNGLTLAPEAGIPPGQIYYPGETAVEWGPFRI